MRSLRSFPVQWDIFCTVVDNFGDIGVTWRLARQLVHEAGQQVRLWVDDLASFQRIAPPLNPSIERQMLDGVEILHWQATPPANITPGRVVIEAFACELPDAWKTAMAAQQPQPLWLNLEYLSAEAWVEDCHGLPSPQPRVGLNKYFYFPGFTEKTGGLLCEQGLLEARDAWLADQAALARYWAKLGLPPQLPGEKRISLFSYPSPSIASLLTAWAGGAMPITALVPEGKAVAEVARFFGLEQLQAGDFVRQGELAVKVLPMTDQAGYDRLLWACDLNIVRGEDSFLRAQWAGRPMLWHIYHQDEDVHLVKLAAFLSRYCAELPEPAAQAMHRLCEGFNRDQPVAALWPAFAEMLPILGQHARGWPKNVLKNGDLLTRLVQFSENRLQ